MPKGDIFGMFIGKSVLVIDGKNNNERWYVYRK
jgi:hypothetical protein